MKKWYQKNWFIVLMLIFVAPIGIYLMYTQTKWGKKRKVFIAVVSVIFAIAVYTPDKEPPEITLSSTTYTIKRGDIMTKEQLKEKYIVSVTDNKTNIKISDVKVGSYSTINFNKNGTYAISLTATDSSDNKTTKKVKLIVEPNQSDKKKEKAKKAEKVKAQKVKEQKAKEKKTCSKIGHQVLPGDKEWSWGLDLDSDGIMCDNEKKQKKKSDKEIFESKLEDLDFDETLMEDFTHSKRYILKQDATYDQTIYYMNSTGDITNIEDYTDIFVETSTRDSDNDEWQTYIAHYSKDKDAWSYQIEDNTMQKLDTGDPVISQFEDLNNLSFDEFYDSLSSVFIDEFQF